MFDFSKSNFDYEVVNAHKPNPVHDIVIRRENDGTRTICIKNLPFDFSDEVASSLTEDEAQFLKQQMATGNKTYQEMCQVVKRFHDARR